MIRLKRLYAHDFKQLRELELHFPEMGRILVQGKNEAGKSTLFEAVFFALFGQALATESSGKPNLEDLIGYEKPKARVELDLVTGHRRFRIVRTLNRGKPNVWQLDIIDGDRIEEVRGNRPVNDRLVTELGFDAEALLNTCFVEQKKLEKLEGLNKAKREESLSKLLNLERLLDLEEKLKLRSDDERMLARLGKRVELAETQQQLPLAVQDLASAEGQLRLIELKVQVERAIEEKRAGVALRDQLQAMQGRRENLKTAVGRVEAFDKARKAMATALDRFDFLTQQSATLVAMRTERAETERAVRDNLPSLEKRGRELGRLMHHLARIIQVEAARGSATNDLQRLQNTQQELSAYLERGADLNKAVSEYSARGEQLDRLLQAYEIGEALTMWATLKRQEAQEGSAASRLEEKKNARNSAAIALRSGLVAPGLALVVLIAATIFVPLLLLLSGSNTLISGLAAAGLFAIDAVLFLFLARRALSLWNHLEQATADLGHEQGAFAARREIATTYAERMKAAESRLHELGAEVPATPATAGSRRIEIAASLENKTKGELSAERDIAREKLNYARAQRDGVVKRIQELQPLASNGDASHAKRSVEKADRILKRWRPVLARQAAELSVEPEYQTVREARQAVENERKNWRQRIEQAAKLGAQIQEAEARVIKTSGEVRAVFSSTQALLDGAVPEWTLELPRSTYLQLEKDLSKGFEDNGGDQVRAQLNALEKEFGACDRELNLREKAGKEAVAAAHKILDELKTTDGMAPDPQLKELEQIAGSLQSINLEDKTAIQTRVRALHQRVGALRDTRERLERELGLQGEAIDLSAACEEKEKERRNQEERKYGAEIVVRARKRMVQKVLPATMDYMRRILPQLTRDRYHDAELDSDTYKIRVWDERAGQSGAWKEKNIFSGGTRDQFSLALRLAFALATLPQERGTSPGFIFLDEPLGSFDDERAAALLYLLTEGEIGRAFDQIFLISHVRVQEDRFTDHLVMENGIVKESSLTPIT